MTQTCVSFAAWTPYALAAIFAGGILIGLSIQLIVDRAELAAYRRVARRPS